VAKQSLASLSVGALVKLRNDISTILSRRVEALKQELRSLGEDYAQVGRIAVYGKKNSAKKRAEKKRGAKTPNNVRGAGRTARNKSAKRSLKTATRKTTSKRKSPKRLSKRR
jgi:hypothetical protein